VPAAGEAQEHDDDDEKAHRPGVEWADLRADRADSGGR
jgi:hypothetical protein